MTVRTRTRGEGKQASPEKTQVHSQRVQALIKRDGISASEAEAILKQYDALKKAR